MNDVFGILKFVFIRIPAIFISPYYRNTKNAVQTIKMEVNAFLKREKRPVYSKFTQYTRDALKSKDFEIGAYTYGTPTVLTYLSGGKLRIGKFCSIASEVTIHLMVSRRTNLGTTYPFHSFPDDWSQAKYLKVEDSIAPKKLVVVIGSDVWIGYGATILCGVEIGDGAIIGAGAVVTKDVEPYSIVVGNPARVKRKRFDEQTIRKLLEIRWWDWPIEKINKNLDIICSDNVDELLRISRTQL